MIACTYFAKERTEMRMAQEGSDIPDGFMDDADLKRRLRDERRGRRSATPKVQPSKNAKKRKRRAERRARRAHA